MLFRSGPFEEKINDHWVYRFNRFNESGVVIYTFPNLGVTANEYKISGESWAQLYPGQYCSPFPGGTYRIESDGLHHGFGGLFLKYPALAGDTFNVAFTDTSYHLEMRVVNSISDTLTVPYGYFSSLYSYTFFDQGAPVGNVWFNNDLWIVKYESIDSLTSGTGVYVNQSYSLVSYTPH